jgi:hypothetical protein
MDMHVLLSGKQSGCHRKIGDFSSGMQYMVYDMSEKFAQQTEGHNCTDEIH